MAACMEKQVKKSHCEIENKLKYNIILTILVYIICTTYMYFISLL